MQRFAPITAAGQRWIHTSFPFNKPQSRLDLHTLILHGINLLSRSIIMRYVQDIHNLKGLLFWLAQYRVVKFLGLSYWE